MTVFSQQGQGQPKASWQQKQNSATPALKSLLLELKGSAWMPERKGNNPRELGFPLPLPIVWRRRPPGPPCLWDGQSRKHSHALWTPLALCCPGFVHAHRKPWYNKLLSFYLTGMEDTMTFTILSLETTTFSVLNEKTFCTYSVTYHAFQ